MFESFHAKHPVHPLVALGCSLFSLMIGMICSATPFLFAYIACLCALFVSYGFVMPVIMLGLGMGVLGIVAGGITALMNGSFDMFWITPARCLLVGIAVVPMLSVPPSQLTRSLNQLRMPRILTLGMLITVRFVPILYNEIFQIREAMRSRGIDTRWWSPAWYAPRNLYRAFLVPLVMRVIGISDTLSLSVETRAFGEGEATVYRPVHMEKRDAVFLALVLVLALLLLIVRFFPF